MSGYVCAELRRLVDECASLVAGRWFLEYEQVVFGEAYHVGLGQRFEAGGFDFVGDDRFAGADVAEDPVR